MNCFDCTTQLQQVTPAVAICSRCGAAICGSHTVQGHAVVEDRSPGNPTRHQLPGRRLYCRTCAPATATALAGVTGAAGAGTDWQS